MHLDKHPEVPGDCIPPTFSHRSAIRLLCWAVLILGCLPNPSYAGESVGTEPVFLSDHPELIVTTQQDWGTLGFNTAAHQPGVPGQPLQIATQTYEKGLGHHANGSIAIILDGSYVSFDAEFGLQPCPGGSAVFRVLVDGNVRLESPVCRSGDAPIIAHVDVTDAQELQLEARDAGDGINCDMANWAQARLTPAAPMPNRTSTLGNSMDMAPFGRTVTWDPRRMDGARASRVQEFRAEDVFTETELRPDRHGNYLVPKTNGIGCIGIQWLNRRAIRELALEFPGPARIPSTNSVRVESWSGESTWQGGWKRAEGSLAPDENRIVFRPDLKKGLLQTYKVRWVLNECPDGLKARPQAFTHSRWETTTVFIQMENPAKASRVKVSIWNGVILKGEGNTDERTSELTWNASKPLRLDLRYSTSSSLNSDPTALRFANLVGTTSTSSPSISVSIPDLLTNPCVYIPDSGLFVAREPLTVTLTDYKKQLAGRKTVLEQVRQIPDQTLAQAMAKTHHDSQSEGPVLLSLACDNTKFVLDRDGTLRFHPAPFAWLGRNEQVDWGKWYAQAIQVRLQPGTTNSGRTRTLEQAWLPVPRVSTESAGVRYLQRTFVAPADPPAPSPWNRKSVCVAEFTATNVHTTPADAKMELVFGAKSVRFTPVSGGTSVWTDNRQIGLLRFEVPDQSTRELTVTQATWAGTLNPGASARIILLLPGNGVAPDQLPTLGTSDQLLSATREYWRSILAGAMQIETPDDFLNNLIRSSQVRCLIAARSEAEGARFGASIAAMSYGPLESEAHSVIRGMDFLGHPEFARRSLDFFVNRYTKEGFLTTGYTTFGTAWHLWTLAEHYQLTRDTNWLRQVAPEVTRVGRWIAQQTRKTRKLTATGAPVPEFGLMPPGVLADWNAFAFHFAMNGYYYAALDGVAQALRDIQSPDAQALQRSARELRANTLRAYAWTQARSPALPLRDGTWIPAYPSQVHSPGKLASFFPGQDAGRSWCYDVELGAHQLVPTGVLGAHSREVDRLLDHMEDVQFLSDGWFDYPAITNNTDWFNLGGFSKVQPYYTRNCEIYALRDDVKPFIRSYFNSIASLVNPEVMTFWEHFRHSGAWDKTHETGYFLHQTRTMLVQERGDELWLAPFLPADWLKPGARITVANAPTRFGITSFQISSTSSTDSIQATITPPTRNPPKRIILRLRHPDGKPSSAARLNGKNLPGFHPGQTITLPAGPGPLHVEVFY